MKKWISDFFSLNEMKTSTLIICFVVVLITTLTMWVVKGSIDSNLKDIIVAFIFTIGGVNAIPAAQSLVNAFKDTTTEEKIDRENQGSTI